MELHDLKHRKYARKKRKRIGRGPGSGHGKTATRGHKGQRSRSGFSQRPGFEGGQMPAIRRIPKRGFTNIFKVAYSVVNINDLERFKEEGKVTPEILLDCGMAKKNMKVKILGNGDIEYALTVQAHAFSASAKEKLEKAGGTAEVIGVAS